jgi:pimeloyl-ACP methyl ester carboxylesterase
MEKRTLSVRDGTFSIELLQGGSGDPLLFLHGSGSLREGEYLDRLAERFTVYAPWHPGFGASTGLDEVDDVIDLALFYHDFMDEIGLASAHVVGHSLGGMLAAELAALCSHRVRRLVLSNPVGLWRDEEPVLDFFTVLPDQLVSYIVHDPQPEVLGRIFGTPQSADEMMEAMYQRLQSLTAAGKFLWPIPDRGLSKRIHRIQAPTLILWGESDGLVPASYAEDFRSSIRDSRVVILKECSHMPMFEKPDEFVSVVTEFLEGR